MQVRLFGELAAAQGGVPVPVPVPVRGAKQRALLAILALQRGQPVSPDRLIDVLRSIDQRRDVPPDQILALGVP